MGGILGKAAVPQTKLEAKIVDAMRRREKEGTSIKSFDNMLLKFPKIDENLQKCKAVFQEFDVDGNGAIDPTELKYCFHKLEINFTDEEINDLFEACDINHHMGIKFNEFIVLLCLAYLLRDNSNALHAQSGMDLPNLESTFETLVDAFVFLDINKDGYVSKSEMVQAINETTSGEGSSGRIAMKRFEEMDWDKNGMVNFKEFLFAFTRWVGIEDMEEEDDESNA
nr:probable calcium-binding protein CML21 isoform X1 [Ipomoea trifida]